MMRSTINESNKSLHVSEECEFIEKSKLNFSGRKISELKTPYITIKKSTL